MRKNLTWQKTSMGSSAHQGTEYHALMYPLLFSVTFDGSDDAWYLEIRVFESRDLLFRAKYETAKMAREGAIRYLEETFGSTITSWEDFNYPDVLSGISFEWNILPAQRRGC